MNQNIIINSDFRVNQRAVSGTVTLTAGQYGHDRWKAGASGCTYAFATSGGKTTITITAGSLIQVIEGTNLQTGTHVLSWEGTATGKIGTGSYSASGLTASVTGGTNLSIEFGTGTLANVKLEKGTKATPFAPRPIGEELALCQRYYEKIQAPSGGIFCSGVNGTTSQFFGALNFTRKRTAPTIVFDTASNFRIHYPGGASTVTSFTLSDIAYDRAVICANASGGLTVGQGSMLERTDNMTPYIALDSEIY